MLDFHNHLMPGVDDGAADLDQARAALRALQEQGVAAVITTPHFDASLTLHPDGHAARMRRIDQGWEALRGVGEAEFPKLRLERGVELMLDTPSPLLEDERVRLAGTSFVLVEFAGLMIPPNAAEALSELAVMEVRPVIAHPERYMGISGGLGMLEGWRRNGCHLQVNTGSLLGRYGENARRVALALLELGWADYLASDFHARGTPTLRDCRHLLLEGGAEEQADLLLGTNPRRLLDDEPPLPVPPVAVRQGLWNRLRAYLR